MCKVILIESKKTNMKISLLIILLALSRLTFGYDKPNSITFDPKTKSYFISNNRGKTITRLDSNFNKKEIITGLTSPKDLLFGTFGPYKGLLVLDSNQVKVFETDSFKLISAFDVSGAIDLEDGEPDKTKSNIFYISDSKAHKIFKVEVGGAPFYIPTFTTLCNFRNAKALLFDSKNRLLCTTDTVQSQVYIINTTTGAKSLLQTTSVDYINSIEEDFEGNFYATNWGDSYVYRMDKDFKNARSLMGYSKPTGLIFNKMYDVLGIACSNCNKVEFYKLHMIYLDNVDTAKCPGDSFYVNPSIQYKGIGTYNKGNSFIIELSDGNGKFSSPLKIGIENTQIEANSYKISLPKNIRFYGNSYKVRIKSTNPVFYSLNELDIAIPYVPSSDFFDKDTIKYCSSNTIILGKKINNSDTMLANYLWYNDGKAFQNYNTTYQYKGSGNHKFLMKAIPKSAGCSVYDSVYLLEYLKIKIPFADTIKVCSKTDAIIGGDSINNSSILWIDKETQKEYSTKFSFSLNWEKGNKNKIFTAKVKSNIAECSAEKDILLLYKNLPQYSLFDDTIFKSCTNNEVMLLPKFVEGDTLNTYFEWMPNSNFNNPYFKNATFNNKINIDTAFTPVLIFRDTISYCQDSIKCKIENFQIPTKPIIKQRENKSVSVLNFNTKFKYRFEIINKNLSVTKGDLNDSTFELKDFANVKSVLVKVSNNQMCDSVSDTLSIIDFTKVNYIKNSFFTIYPNPGNGYFNLKTNENEGKEIYVKITDLSGREIFNTRTRSNQKINIYELEIGYYFINITFENKIFNTVLIKE